MPRIDDAGRLTLASLIEYLQLKTPKLVQLYNPGKVQVPYALVGGYLAETVILASKGSQAQRNRRVIEDPIITTSPPQPVVVPALDIPRIVNGGAPIGMKYQNRYLKNNVECMGRNCQGVCNRMGGSEIHLTVRQAVTLILLFSNIPSESRTTINIFYYMTKGGTYLRGFPISRSGKPVQPTGVWSPRKHGTRADP